jgi:hypothetical protein
MTLYINNLTGLFKIRENIFLELNFYFLKFSQN